MTSVATTELSSPPDAKEESKNTNKPVQISAAQKPPRVYFQRWIQLGYLSSLALLSDWVCFSFAASPEAFESYYQFYGRGDTHGEIHASSLIDVFLFTNVASTWFVTDIVQRFGMKNSIRSASFLMAIGCWFRSGFAFITQQKYSDTGEAVLAPYNFVVIGTVLVGAAQPFFQCTPPRLSATWFASNERATSTAVALNFNQIGIAVAFLVGGEMGTSVEGLQNYNALIAILSTLLLFGTLYHFQEAPPTPPSTSELEKLKKSTKDQHDLQEPPFLVSVKAFFGTQGFTRPLAAFVCSISITNVFGAFIDDFLKRGGITEKFSVALTGTAFEVAIVLGGILIGGYVDRTKEYKKVTLLCLCASVVFLIALGAQDEQPVLFVISLIGLGLVIGPIQPINAELAVDVSYPADETAVESVQQISGNLVSALLVPLAERAARLTHDSSLLSFRYLPPADILLLISIVLATFAFFRSFNAPLQRTIADQKDDHLREAEIRANYHINELNRALLLNDKNEKEILLYRPRIQLFF